MSLQILLVDDHAIVRQGIRQLLIDRGIARAKSRKPSAAATRS
ncbi:response regulator [Burkholderia pseudomallei]|nr:response regulator [Burkholderia pseudomallei]